MASRGLAISHDYTDALGRDSLTSSFDVTVAAHHADGSVIQATRTIAVFCVYAYNKLRHGLLTPRVDVFEPVTLAGLVLCGFTIHNLEDEELSFSAEKHEWLTTEPDTVPRTVPHLVPGEVSIASSTAIGELYASPAPRPRDTPLAFAGRALGVSQQVAPLHIPGDALDIRVPARSAVTLVRAFSSSEFKKPVFGVAVHLQGKGLATRTPACASAYIEVRLPLEWGGAVLKQPLIDILSSLKLAGRAKTTITHDLLRDLSYQPPVPPGGSSAPERLRQIPEPSPGVGAAGRLPSPSVLSAHTQIAGAIHELLTPPLIPLDEQVPMIGNECDPDNLPDNLPEGMVCQLTSETAWRFVPGRVANAKKGDIVLSHDGQGMVGQMLQHLTPPQFYSHSGIMTKNHIELRHSTASEEWLLDHAQSGSGLDPTALKYLWPGTITQAIDKAAYFEWLPSPDKGSYAIHGFSFLPDTGNVNTIVYPLVVSPPPFAETAQVRLKLHSIANEAVLINGHYRFFCYTAPSIALDPGHVAGPEAGWAKGTVPTVCSSFIWLSAQHAGIRLEGSGTHITIDDLEPSDTAAGAAVDADTRDGLYLYNAGERQAAARWLYQTIYDLVYSKSGWWGRLLTDAPDNYANQVCNTFASDWPDGDSINSDSWKSTGAANAVSPDNIKFWDSPGPGNQHQFAGAYGYFTEAQYTPGTYARVPIYRWEQVLTRGTLTGAVQASADVSGANVSLLGSGEPNFVVGSDGRFEFDNVPAGRYTVSAGLNINGYWNSADVTALIAAGGTTDITITLQPPPEVDRLITVSVDMETDWTAVYAHSPHVYYDTRSVRLQPFHSHEHLEFEGGDTPHGRMIVDLDLNADLSVTVSYQALEIDDEVEGGTNGGFDIPKDCWHSRTGITVSNGDWIDNDATVFTIKVTNDQASA